MFQIFTSDHETHMTGRLLANTKCKNMKNINELSRKMNGKEETVNAAQREDAREGKRKRQRMRKQ